MRSEACVLARHRVLNPGRSCWHGAVRYIGPVEPKLRTARARRPAAPTETLCPTTLEGAAAAAAAESAEEEEAEAEAEAAKKSSKKCGEKSDLLPDKSERGLLENGLCQRAGGRGQPVLVAPSLARDPHNPTRIELTIDMRSGNFARCRVLQGLSRGWPALPM